MYSLYLCVGCVFTFTQNYSSSLASVPGGGGDGCGSLCTCCSFPVFPTHQAWCLSKGLVGPTLGPPFHLRPPALFQCKCDNDVLNIAALGDRGRRISEFQASQSYKVKPCLHRGNGTHSLHELWEEGHIHFLMRPLIRGSS